MDQKKLREREAQCIQENPPGCSAACPVHVDVRGLIAAVRKEDYAAGFALFQKAVPFPRILCRICDQPCQASCKRSELDEAVSIRALERICTDRNDKAIVQSLAIPQSSKNVAVVGAGLSGLTAAVELIRKGCAVTIFEAEGRLGGSVWSIPESLLPAEEIAQDLLFFDKLNSIINLKMPIGDSKESGRTLADLCGEYDAVYLAVGCDGNVSTAWGLALDGCGRVVIEPDTLKTSITKVFAGGSLRLGDENRSPILSVADGKKAANSIERFMQGASLSANREKEGPFKTSLYTNVAGIKPEAAVICADPEGGYTTDEARREAERCLLCECRECVKVCEYMSHYGSYPKRYVREVYNNLSIVMGIHHSNKMINTCSLCGLCEEICPQKLDMGEVCLEARRMMVGRGKMPPSTHDFALRDMRFSNSDQFMLSRHQSGFSSSRFVFFPGCQHAAASPLNVQKIYEYLCDKLGDGVALMLGCCGAPAYWSGQEELFRETLQEFERNWRDLGSPQIITACPTCFSMLRNNAPYMPLDMLWTLLDRIGLPDRKEFRSVPRKLAVHDSCSTRHEAELQNSVRSLLSKLGHEVEELPANNEHTVCCGYGGLMIFADREVAKKVINRRIHESETDYLAYCAMCRDNFASQGKRAFYLLDLLFEADAEKLATQESPGYSQRQENRGRLKRNVLREIWGETVEELQAEIKVVISENVQKIMDERMILVEDVIKVIAHAERSGDKLKIGDDGRLLAYFQPLRVTYWVEYSPYKEGFLLHNTYSHRIEILK